MQVVVQLTDQASPTYRRLEALLQSPERLHKAMAQGALPVVQGHFRKMAGSNHNKFGVRSSFWNRMLAGTRASSSAAAATIAMPREMALRYFGGRVTPKASKYLTIPLRAESYGKSIRQFDDIQFARIGGKLFAFTRSLNAGARSENTGALRKRRATAKGRARITLLFLLVPSAEIEGNPEVLPTEAALLAGAAKGAQTLIDVTAARGQNGGAA